MRVLAVSGEPTPLIFNARMRDKGRTRTAIVQRFGVQSEKGYDFLVKLPFNLGYRIKLAIFDLCVNQTIAQFQQAIQLKAAAD